MGQPDKAGSPRGSSETNRENRAPSRNTEAEVESHCIFLWAPPLTQRARHPLGSADFARRTQRPAYIHAVARVTRVLDGAAGGVGDAVDVAPPIAAEPGHAAQRVTERDLREST